ncbi:uncharacterized protein LOC134264259 [Saccostrea cucullata]|uniref:uncharacterized protein LOC134264259 n=1 Tax=Saccostrea cuccullata TaxID=36930 RepID=UPI002ED662AF
MEPDMCIQMLQELGQNDVNVSTVIMDNDSTTVARARLELQVKHQSPLSAGSKSNDFRIAAAVAQKNLGHQYVIQKSQESSEIREGTTYKTCVDLNNNEGDMENITEIPPPLRKPQSTPIVHDQCTFVYFDLETTGLGKDCEVTQIGAYASEKSFSQYILPSTQPISPSATAVSGIAVKENIMFKNGVQVPCKNAKDGIETFITWLKNFSNIVLVAHNAKFDSNVIIRAMHQVGLRASDFIIGFVDTLPLLEKLFPTESLTNKWIL